jgi:hypothetical protein
VLEHGAVGHVQVDIGQRVPGVHQRQHGLHLRRIGFHVIAVQVEILGGGAPAHFDRAALVRAVPFGEALVAVDVEHRDEQQHLLVEDARGQLLFQHLAQRQEAGVLAVDLAGVDAALDQRDRHFALAAAWGVNTPLPFTASASIGRPSGVVPNWKHFTCLGIGLLEGAAQRDDFVVAAGGGEAGALGDGDQVGGGVARGMVARRVASNAERII